MSKNTSIRDLDLSSNERLFNKNNHKSLFQFTQIKKFTSEFVKFYTFHVGFKKRRDDLLIAVFSNPVPVSAVYSKTSTPSAPIIWDKKNNKGFCKVLIINAGNANAHTGKEGINSINKYTKIIAKKYNCSVNKILVSSTGVIGEKLDENKIIKAFLNIEKKNEKDIFTASKAIMTTDTYSKTALENVVIKSKKINVFGFAKGSGMIAPNMGTMLGYIFIESNILKKDLNKILKSHLNESFNSITVDGDTSTSDTVMLFSLSNTQDKPIIDLKNLSIISQAVKKIMFNLALQVVSDGEGISKLIQINISGAKSHLQASKVGFSIGNSLLVKTAISGQDANWGRIIMAIGKADSNISQNKIKIKFARNEVCSNGKVSKKINIKKLDSYMKNKIIEINVSLGNGKYKRTIYSSDLTHEYIRINGDYRS